MKNPKLYRLMMQIVNFKEIDDLRERWTDKEVADLVLYYELRMRRYRKKKIGGMNV